MKKFATLAATALLAGALLLTGCGGDTKAPGADKKSDKPVVTVGASPLPHSEILNQVKPLLAKEGVELKIVEFTDYVKPNLALNDKELDANYFQHIPYLEKFASEHKLNLANAVAVHIEPMGIYSKSLKELAALPEGAKVAIPNDPTNGGRALLLLQKAGIIALKDGGTITSTVADITDNKKKVQVVELEAPQLPRSLDDVAIAVINTNYALEAKLNPTKDALFIEDKNSPYVNILAIRKGDEKREEIQKLVKALQSPEVKKYIEDTYKGAILPVF